jgi:DnaJ-class molecular chaperone
MTAVDLLTKWKFVVEFEDEDTKEISGTFGQANSREECEALIEYDTQVHSSNGRTVINVEAVEVCARCEGEGKILAGTGRQLICHACGGHHGSISNL